ncbi:MAG TPA: metallophosphoesterase [Acidimicrobiales bacterium]
MDAPDVATVSDDSAVVFAGPEVRHYEGLDPDTEYEIDGAAFRTLPRPPGERLATITTVNDVHFGETVCGMIAGQPDIGPVLRAAEDEPPYPETMNAAAVEEMAALDPDLVVAKGDLTDDGRDGEYEAFLRCYGRFGDRLLHVRGNHDAYRGQVFADFGPQRRDVPGAAVVLLDTTTPRSASGQFTADDEAWLDDVASSAARAGLPVLVFGHHHVWSPDSTTRPASYYGIVPDGSERLVAVFERRPNLAGYFAGHTHRNRVKRISATGRRPWVEVACVKDFPGAWAEYRVFEGGVLQVFHRVVRPDALAWAERTRAMFDGTYAYYAYGTLADRCFAVTDVTQAR